MDDRFNTIAGWVLFAGIVALGSSIVAGEFFHSERPEKMGYPIAGVEQEGEGGAAAEQPIEVYLAKAEPRRARRVQEMRRLPQRRKGRAQPARAQSVGRARRADRPGPGFRFLRRPRQEGRNLELGQSQPVADQPQGFRARHQNDLRRPRQPAGPRQCDRVPQPAQRRAQPLPAAPAAKRKDASAAKPGTGRRRPRTSRC